MDTKNVIAAISLSAAVIILYSLFFAPPPKEINNLYHEKTVLNSEAPKLDSSDKFIEISKLKIALTRNNFHAINFQGGKYNPLLRDWSYSKFKSINYLFCATG